MLLKNISPIVSRIQRETFLTLCNTVLCCIGSIIFVLPRDTSDRPVLEHLRKVFETRRVLFWIGVFEHYGNIGNRRSKPSKSDVDFEL